MNVTSTSGQVWRDYRACIVLLQRSRSMLPLLSENAVGCRGLNAW